MSWPVAAARNSFGEDASYTLSIRRVWRRPFVAPFPLEPLGARPPDPVPSPPRPSENAKDMTSISPLCLSSVLSPATPSSLRNMSADGPPAWVGVEKVSSFDDEDESLEPTASLPAGPGSPCGPCAPAGPDGPSWAQVTAVSSLLHCSLPESRIRTAPFGRGAWAVLRTQARKGPADGIAATPTAAPAPSDAIVGSANFRPRGGVCGHMLSP